MAAKKKAPPAPTEYFFDRDNSNHWYMIDASKRHEWEKWAALDEDDEAGWETPPFAKRLNGPVSAFTFVPVELGELIDD